MLCKEYLIFPPKQILVGLEIGILIILLILPNTLYLITHPPSQQATHKKPLLSTHIPSVSLYL